MSSSVPTSSRASQRLLSVPISVLGMSFVLLMVCSEAGAADGRGAGRWSTCEVSLRLGVAGWERTTTAVLFAKRLADAPAALGVSLLDAARPVVTARSIRPVVAPEAWQDSTDAPELARRGLADLPPPASVR